MNKMDEEIAAALRTAETQIPPADEPGEMGEPRPPAVQGGGWATNVRYAWQYRPQFEPAVGEPGDEPELVVAKRIAAAFESIATSMQILSEAQMTLAQDAVYNTEHK